MTSDSAENEKPKGRKKQKRPTRELILDEAERLIMAGGVYNLKLQDIAAPLGITVPAIYKHFTSREDVLIGLGMRNALDFSTVFSRDPDKDAMEALKEGCLDFTKHLISHPVYVYFLLLDYSTPGGWVALDNGRNLAVKDRQLINPSPVMIQALDEIMTRGRQAGQFREMDLPQFLTILFGGIVSLLLWPSRNALLSGLDSTASQGILTQVEELVERLAAK